MAFLRRGGWTIIHAGIIGGGLFYSAREIFSHDHSDSTDVYRRPVESPFSQSLNTPIAPLIEPFEELSPVSPINEALPLTTPEYVTITITPTPEDEDHDPSPVPPVRGNLNGHDPYADNPFIQAWARKIAPIFGNSYFQALVRTIEFFWNHRFTQVIVRAINALISFGFYLWLLLPGGLRDLMELICDWAWISAFIVWLLKWLLLPLRMVPLAETTTIRLQAAPNPRMLLLVLNLQQTLHQMVLRLHQLKPVHQPRPADQLRPINQPRPLASLQLTIEISHNKHKLSRTCDRILRIYDRPT
jgi:hypothetical protein